MLSKKQIFILIGSLVLFMNYSCTTLSKNMVRQGDLEVIGGVYKKNKWNDSLLFKRYSWFQELTLYFDACLAKVEKKSPFLSWFSKSEKIFFEQCNDYYIALSYKLDSGLITEGMFLEEMEKNGYERIYIPTFESHFRVHPDSKKLSTESYKLYALCSRRGQKHDVNKTINFPGFKEIVIE